jgi:glycosyltransferase involved in cell wall biosynthesis
LGKISYQELPEYAASFDVALIPFLVNELTISVNPLKLMEYLACGLPVISTRLPEVVRYAELVYLADSPEEFARAISRAFSEDSPAVRLMRRETARSKSWDAVAESMSGAIERIVS